MKGYLELEEPAKKKKKEKEELDPVPMPVDIVEIVTVLFHILMIILYFLYKE